MKIDPKLHILDQLVSKDREIVQNFADRHEVIKKCGESMKEAIREVRSRGWQTHEKVWNACLFVNTISYDLSHKVYALVYERDDWKRRLAARELAVLIYEAGEDIPTVFGKNFRSSCATLGISKALTSALDKDLKRVSNLWNENRSILK
ncbi:MAG: hypothetical protein AAFY98_07530 [Verrucomicrobiota bacterium]